MASRRSSDRRSSSSTTASCCPRCVLASVRRAPHRLVKHAAAPDTPLPAQAAGWIVIILFGFIFALLGCIPGLGGHQVRGSRVQRGAVQLRRAQHRRRPAGRRHCEFPGAPCVHLCPSFTIASFCQVMTWVSLGLQVSHWTWASILWVLLPLFCMQVAVLSCCVAADKLRPSPAGCRVCPMATSMEQLDRTGAPRCLCKAQ